MSNSGACSHSHLPSTGAAGSTVASTYLAEGSVAEKIFLFLLLFPSPRKMKQVFLSSSSASSIARAEAQNKHLCFRGGEWDTWAVSKLKATLPSPLPPQYLLKSLN